MLIINVNCFRICGFNPETAVQLTSETNTGLISKIKRHPTLSFFVTEASGRNLQQENRQHYGLKARITEKTLSASVEQRRLL
jgi:hypothetical protein